MQTMPSMSVVPWHCRVTHASSGTYTINPDDCTIVPVNAGPKGTSWVIQLPDTNSPDPPASGDFYLVNDAVGLVNIFHHLVVQAGPTYTVEGQPNIVFEAPFSWAAFQFDARNRRWAVFQGKVA
jgi:hypothetical protein